MTSIDDGLFPPPACVSSDAIVSACGAYRYELSRSWSEAPGTAVFVTLNPSTADADVDDPTIRRCVGFSQRWGMGHLVVVNLYAYRATDPAELRAVEDPVGPANDEHLRRVLSAADTAGDPVVAAWGAHAGLDRVQDVLGLGVPLLSLGVTKAGRPRHPLYLRNDAVLTGWESPESTRANMGAPRAV